MNPLTVAHAKRIVAEIRKTVRKIEHTTVVACPPFPFISFAIPKIASASVSENSKKAVSKAKGVLLGGAQNVFFEESGAFTGEVSASMLADMGVSYVIVGHSERRKMGETDETISKKVNMVADKGMMAVLCVGEQDRDGQGAYLDFLKEQIRTSLTNFPKKALAQLIVAYEPVWAIGAKEAMTPGLIHEMTIFIKKTLSDMFGQEGAMTVPILYGGSVNFRNAAEIISVGEVDGLLVGRESVNPPGFDELLKVVDMI